MINDGLLDCELKGIRLRQTIQNKDNTFYKRHITKQELEEELEEEEDREMEIMK